MDETQIGEEFAKDILSACYALDARLAEIETVFLSAVNGPERDKLKKTFSSLVTLVGARILVPIYQQHPNLGRVMEPGPWLPLEVARRKFGIR